MTVETETTSETEAAVTDVAPRMNEHAAEGIHPAAKPFLFLGNLKTRRNFIWLPLIGMIICIVLGLIHPQKHAMPIEKYVPGSWAVYGFIAYSIIVLSANTLFKILGRDESYYGEGGLPNPEYSTDPMITGEAHHD